MRSWGEIETGTIVTLSTAHIDPDSLKALDHVVRQEGQPSHPTKWTKSLHWGASEYGYFVNGHGLREILKDAAKDQYPEFLQEAAKLATDLQITWLYYDQDGEEIAGMVSYADQYYTRLLTPQEF